MSAEAHAARTATAVSGRTGVLAADLRTGGLELRADEPAAQGGGGTGPDPFEYVLAGLAACTVMTLRLYADRKGWPLERAEARVRHAARAAGGARDVFERDIRLIGDLSQAERARLLEIAERCPVGRALQAGIEVRSSLVDAAEPGPAAS